MLFPFCSIAGPNTSTDWAIEGRRLIPLMPRLVPQTAFTALANNVANIAAAENARLPPPANTVKKNRKFKLQVSFCLNMIIYIYGSPFSFLVTPLTLCRQRPIALLMEMM
jgi:hypothetical protein